MVGLGARLDLNSVIQRVKAPHRGWAIVFRVASTAELGRDVVAVGLDADPLLGAAIEVAVAVLAVLVVKLDAVASSSGS